MPERAYYTNWPVRDEEPLTCDHPLLRFRADLEGVVRCMDCKTTKRSDRRGEPAALECVSCGETDWNRVSGPCRRCGSSLTYLEDGSWQRPNGGLTNR